MVLRRGCSVGYDVAMIALGSIAGKQSMRQRLRSLPARSGVLTTVETPKPRVPIARGFTSFQAQSSAHQIHNPLVDGDAFGLCGFVQYLRFGEREGKPVAHARRRCSGAWRSA
jgi:hypothetical protein